MKRFNDQPGPSDTPVRRLPKRRKKLSPKPNQSKTKPTQNQPETDPKPTQNQPETNPKPTQNETNPNQQVPEQFQNQINLMQQQLDRQQKETQIFQQQMLQMFQQLQPQQLQSQQLQPQQLQPQQLQPQLQHQQQQQQSQQGQQKDDDPTAVDPTEAMSILDGLMSVSNSQNSNSENEDWRARGPTPPPSTSRATDAFIDLEPSQPSSQHQFETPINPPQPNSEIPDSPIDVTPAPSPYSPMSPSVLKYVKKRAQQHKKDMSSARIMNMTVHVTINHSFGAGRRKEYRKTKARNSRQPFATKSKSDLIKDYYRNFYPDLYNEWGAHFDAVCPVKPHDINVWLRNIVLYGSVHKQAPQNLPEPPNPAED